MAFAKGDVVDIEERLQSKLAQADPLAKVLARVLIERGITTGPELIKKLIAGDGDEQESWRDALPQAVVDSRGKRWIR
ncbi:MAG: hypothetical protein ACE5HC_03255 [Candidatus Binatia bacterium]